MPHNNPDKGEAPAKPKHANKGDGKSGNHAEGTPNGTSDAGLGGDGTLYIVNNSDLDVCWAYADDCEGGEGPELLGDLVLPSNYYATLTGLDSSACYSLWALPCDSDGAWNLDVDGLGAEFTWVLTADGGGGCDSAGGCDTSGDTGTAETGR